MKTILIATNNEGKYKELKKLLSELPIACISLHDLDKKIPEPDEAADSIEGNAILKAKYYAKESGYTALADDAGLFIDALNGWPGVKSARICADQVSRTSEVLQRLDGVNNEKRTAHFMSVLALYDPKTNALFVAHGKTEGNILNKEQGTHGFGYDPIFHVASTGKTYAEMSEDEKNKVSHRAKAYANIKRFILNTYGGKHICVPLGVVVKDGKILLNKRNDPEQPEVHGLWEFPGGGVEIGEKVEESVLREVEEECGYRVKIITQLRFVWTVHIKNPRGAHSAIQIYLIPFVCKIIGGDGKVNDTEVMETVWVSPDEVSSYNLIGENQKMYEGIYTELMEVIKTNNL